jgi:hypothetical protein
MRVTGDPAVPIETGEPFEALCAQRASEATPVKGRLEQRSLNQTRAGGYYFSGEKSESSQTHQEGRPRREGLAKHGHAISRVPPNLCSLVLRENRKLIGVAHRLIWSRAKVR